MNFDEYIDFGIENTPESIFGGLTFGQTLSGAEILTRTDGLSDEVMEEIFEYLDEEAITIDLTDLPRQFGSGESVRRLREEEQLVKRRAADRSGGERSPAPVPAGAGTHPRGRGH